MQDKVIQIRPGIGLALENYLARDPGPPEGGRTAVARSQSSEQRWRISPVLDELKRRKTLTPETHAAACRFLYEYYLALYMGPRTQKYERSSPSSGGHDGDIQRLHYALETEKAILSLSKAYHPALKWLISTLGESKPLSSLGEFYAEDLGAQTQSARCGAVLFLMCVELCEHYGIPCSLLDKKIRSISVDILKRFPEK